MFPVFVAVILYLSKKLYSLFFKNYFFQNCVNYDDDNANNNCDGSKCNISIKIITVVTITFVIYTNNYASINLSLLFQHLVLILHFVTLIQAEGGNAAIYGLGSTSVDRTIIADILNMV